MGKKKINLKDLRDSSDKAKKDANGVVQIDMKDIPKKEVKPTLSQAERDARQARADATPNIISNLEDVAEKTEYHDYQKENMDRMVHGIDEGLSRVKQDIQKNVMGPMREKLEAQAEQKAMEDLDKQVSTNTSADTAKVASTVSDKDEVEFDKMVGNDKTAMTEHAVIPGESAKSDLGNIDVSELTKGVEMDKEMEELIAEMDDELPEVKDDRTPEEKEIEENLVKSMISAYRASIRNSLSANNRIFKSGRSLKVAKTSISITKALRDVQSKVADTFSFPLIQSGRMITMSALTGDEIPMLNARQYNSDMEAARAMYTLMYQHDVSPNKPKEWDVWLKSICDWDIYNLYFAAYGATFKNSNYIGYSCPECGNMFLKEIPITEMYRKHPSASKNFDERVKKIVEAGDNSVPSEIESNLVQISSNFALGLHAPSIYSASFETSALDPAFRRKHGQMANLAQYVDGVYRILDDGMTAPINFKIDQNNTTKTVKMKIIALERIIKTLSTDEAAMLASTITNINSAAEDRYQFVIPGVDCGQTYGPIKDRNGKNRNGEKCTNHIDEITSNDRVEINPLDLFFTRHRLAQFAYYEIEL